MGSYDFAQICSNGHVINSRVGTWPGDNKSFCPQCGSPAVESCPQCHARIQGSWVDELPAVIVDYQVPNYCANCGRPYPWTEARVSAAKDMADELELSVEEKAKLKESIDDLVADSPQSPVAAARFKRLVAKAGAGIAEGFRSILVDVLSEAVRKSLWPTP